MRRVTDRKMAEIPQPMYVMKVRIVFWRGLIIDCLERSCKKESRNMFRIRIRITVRSIITK